MFTGYFILKVIKLDIDKSCTSVTLLKPTEKAVEEKIRRLKGERKGKLAQITKQKNDLAKLKENEYNVNFIKDEELLRFERCLKQYERINEELCELIDEDDKKADQDAYEN